jgi:HD-like signal output (HDOD) protein
MNDNIIKNIKLLPPLPSSTLEIYEVCSDTDSSLVDVVNVVKKDPIAVATLLKIANSSLYGSRNIKIVDRAIGMFGKSVTKAYLVNDAIVNSFTIDLSAYGISEEEFALVSQKRTKLMSEWYGEIDKSMLDVLSTTAQVGNIGQILLAKSMIDAGSANDFSEALGFGEDEVEELEEEFLGFNTLDVSAKILQHWKLDSMLIDSLEYSKNLDTISRAPEDIKDYAIANFIVFHAIDVNGNTTDDGLDMILDVLHDNNLNEERFEDLLAEIRTM